MKNTSQRKQKLINLSLSALGKCINALAQNSSHVPIRDSKLTRLLRDSFGGSAKTLLIVTIGPSPRHRGETASTIMFGQRVRFLELFVGYLLCSSDFSFIMSANQGQMKKYFARVS